MSSQITLEEFRKTIDRLYNEKGVEPPIPGSQKEQELYQQWLKGAVLLEKLKNDSSK